MAGVQIPTTESKVRLRVGGREVRLTSLDKPYWPEIGLTKRHLLQYYADIAPVLLPHIDRRPMVMKRYPEGWKGEHFFMKRTPAHAPEWIERCPIEHGSGSVIDFPLVTDLASLLWMVNLGCIDLNPWYTECDQPRRPDRLVFDLDPVPGADFERVREAALRVREGLEVIGMRPRPKTSGSRGIHVYVPIRPGPDQKEVWRVAKGFARLMEERHPELCTAEYRIKKRPAGRVLVDYNQNAWGRTLAAAYSVRPRESAPVSAPLEWEELEAGARPADFRIDNLRERLDRVGDLWRPLVWPTRGRFDLSPLLEARGELREALA